MSDNLDSANYLRFISMVIDLGTEAMLLLFYHLKPIDDVPAFLTQPRVKDIIGNLKKRKILRHREYQLVVSNPNPDQFDLNLLITLLSNIFEDDIEAPAKGWKKIPPASKDLSVGADLLRMKRIRNEIVSHHLKAQLPSVIYDDLWQQTEGVIVRIVDKVDSNKVHEMKKKLSEYSTRSLDGLDAIKHGTEIVKVWYDEIRMLQVQVEDMAKKSKALYDTLQCVQHHHRKYYKLLIEGGRIILVGIWQRERQLHGEQDMSDMLEKNITTKYTVKQEQLVLSRYNRENDWVDNLPILDIGTLILQTFESKLDNSEVSAIKELLCLVKSHTDIVFMSNKTFMTRWTSLVMHLTLLATKLTSEMQSNLRDSSQY